MNDSSQSLSRTPGIVIFVAVLNFISAFFFAIFSALCTVALVFGNVLGISEYLVSKMSEYPQTAHFTAGMNLVFTIALLICFSFAVFFALVGVGLLKTHRLAWYFQIALSVLGLIGFPFYTILNALILVMFFQNNVRDHFRV